MLTHHNMDTSPTEEWLDLLNSDLVRKHLLPHPLFTVDSVRIWIESKVRVDQEPLCLLRAIRSDGKLIGWCGIQIESGDYELALVLSPKFWGHGREVLNQIKLWAKKLGHKQLLAHMPQTRQQMKALERLFGKPVGTSNIEEYVYDTYRIVI